MFFKKSGKGPGPEGLSTALLHEGLTSKIGSDLGKGLWAKPYVSRPLKAGPVRIQNSMQTLKISLMV